MTPRDKLAARYAEAKRRHKGQARAFADLQAQTHADLSLRRRCRMARLWALLLGE